MKRHPGGPGAPGPQSPQSHLPASPTAPALAGQEGQQRQQPRQHLTSRRSPTTRINDSKLKGSFIQEALYKWNKGEFTQQHDPREETQLLEPWKQTKINKGRVFSWNIESHGPLGAAVEVLFVGLAVSLAVSLARVSRVSR